MATPPSPDVQPFVVSASLLTDTGCVRESNEDSCGVVQPTDSAMLDHKGVLLVVADGMGGCQAGELASRLAVEMIARAYYESSGTPPQALTYAFRLANNQIYKLALGNGEFSGMGTTCTALVIYGRVAYSAHVGDSRLYLVRSNSIYQMTEDHSVVKELVRQGALTTESARRHPGRNLILRALGSHATIEVETWDQPLPVRSGDCFVLCSDGLHDAVSDDEICLATQSGETGAACESLVATARSRGGRDNITVAIARVGG
ncbi:MAG TPA: Stp1/IreP family PP2C-type Ser/Thr phosphatase [Bryobacteraceae bacterium]|jgi:protein phosphatase